MWRNCCNVALEELGDEEESRMCQQIIMMGGVPGLFSWTEGFHPSNPPQIVTDQDVQAAAARLERCGESEEARSLRECWCAHPDDRVTIERFLEEAWAQKPKL